MVSYRGPTPARYNVTNGLRGIKPPVYGPWGGRFYHDDNKNTGTTGHMKFWHEAEDDGDLYKPLCRWWDHNSQWHYAARSAWTTAPSYDDANHAPVVGDVGPLNREVAPGQTVTLSCSGSSDPDGDNLSYHWYQYYTRDTSAWYTDSDPWSVSPTVTVSNATSASGASFTVPDEIAKHVLIVLEVTDDGFPSLTRYAQIDFHIVSDPVSSHAPATPASGAKNPRARESTVRLR